MAWRHNESSASPGMRLAHLGGRGCVVNASGLLVYMNNAEEVSAADAPPWFPPAVIPWSPSITNNES